MFSFGLTSQLLLFLSLGFAQPVRAIHLQKYGLKPLWIGIFFSVTAFAYFLNSLVITCCQRLLSRRGIVFIALTLLVVSFFLVGTSPMLNFKDSPVHIFFGLFLAGVAAAGITIPILPEI